MSSAAPGERDAPAADARALFLLIAGGLLIRMAFAASTGLGVDETYMVAIGRHWEWSFFDHPPLAWWLTHAASSAAGLEAGWIVRAPFILLFAASTWLMYRLGTDLFGNRAGIISACLLNAAPVLGVTSASWVLPDGPLDAALLAAACCLARALFGPAAPNGWWLAAGLSAGLALLSKLHGGFVIVGAFVFLLASPEYRGKLATPWPWLGGALALAMTAPVILWNADHDWASFAFQGGRAAARNFRPWLAALALAGQALFLAPWIWAPLAVSVWQTCQNWKRDARARLLLCLGGGPVIFFTLVAAWSSERPLFHWAAPGYLLLLPLLGRWLAERYDRHRRGVRRLIGWAFAFNIAAMTMLAIISIWPQALAPLRVLSPDLAYPLAEMVDWRDVADYWRKLPDNERPRLVIARRWYEAAKIDYALHGAADVACIGDDCRGYNFVKSKEPHAGDDALIIIPENAAPTALPPIAQRFVATEAMPPLRITQGPFVILALAARRGHGFVAAP